MDRYNKFSKHLKEKFGERVYKVSIDAAFPCPNKDGVFSADGCIYCDNKSFSFNSRHPVKPIEQQIQEGMDFAKERYDAKKFIVYFQANTNTYAPLGVLKQKYDIIRHFSAKGGSASGGKDVVGISIGTRPDCVDEDILDLIKSYSTDFDVWVEYGLQSIHDKTLQLINRQHDYETFLKAVELARERNISICAHIIIGLPGENKDEILQTAKELARLKIGAVKIHPLHVVKNTKLEELLNANQYKPLDMNEFIDISVEFLEHLWPNTVIQRIGADCPKELLTAPMWVLEKEAVLGAIEKKLEERDSYQGKNYIKELSCQIPLTKNT